MGVLMRELREADQRQQLPGAHLTLVRRHAFQFQSEFDIALRRAPRQEIGLLKDDAPIVAGAANRPSADRDLARVGFDQPLDDAQHRRFAATAFADERHDFSFEHVKTYRTQHR